MHVAGSHYPGGNSIDRGVKKVQANQNAVQRIIAHDFFGYLLELVFQQHHMVAVPADRPGHMQRNLIKKGKQAWNFIADHLSGMVVSIV